MGRMKSDYEKVFESVMRYANKNIGAFEGGNSDDLRSYIAESDARGLLGGVTPYLEETKGWERAVTDRQTVDFLPQNVITAGTVQGRKLNKRERHELRVSQAVQRNREQGRQVVYRRGHPIALYPNNHARDLQRNRWTKYPRLKKEERT